MPSTYSNLKFQLMATGENNTTWGDVTNLNLGTAIEEAIAGSADVTFASGNVTLTLTDTNASQTARNMRLRCTGTTGGATRNLVVPSIEKAYIVKNDCADSILVKTAAGSGVTVPAGSSRVVYNDGTNVVDAVTSLGTLVGDLQFGGTAQRILGDFSNATISSRLTFQSSGTNQNTAVNAIPSGTASQTNFVCFNSSNPDNASFMSIAATATDARVVSSIVGSGTNLPMTFFIGGAERVRIDTSGNVGIGTASSGERLYVSAGSGVQIGASDGTTTQRVGYCLAGIAYSGTASNHPYALLTNDVERLRINTSGNVGIGTTTPSTILDVNGGLTIRGDNNGYTLFAPKEGTDPFGVNYDRFEIRVNDTTQETTIGNVNGGTGSPRALAFLAGGTERMRIGTTGYVGINTTTPDAYLHSEGFTSYRGNAYTLATFCANGTLAPLNIVQATDGTIPGISAGQNSTATFSDLGFYTSETERMRILSGGDVGIGTTTPQGKTEIRTASGGAVTDALVLSNFVNASVNTGVALHFDPNGAGSLARTASIRSVQSTSGNYADLRFFTANSTTPAEYFRIAAGGAFGLSGANYGTSGQVLTSQGSSSPPIWTTITPGAGTVTSVGGTGTVNGITLTGTVTSSGNLTLGGSVSSVATGATIDGVTISYRSIPRSTTSGTAVVGDVGKCIAVSAGITIPNSTFAAGDAISIYNDSGSAITITAGVTTLRQAGTANTGNRTLAARGMATVWFNSATEAVISGAGVT